MCRNIKTLHHFEPPATAEEVRASALQYVRKLTGTNRPAQASQAVWNGAVDEITALTLRLFAALATQVHTPPRTREDEKKKALERGKKREAQLRARYGSAK